MSSESSSVKVAVRIRPLNIDNSSHPSIECSNSFIQSNQLEKQVKVVGASSLPILSDSLFTFDHVFDESSSQTTIYNECVNDLVISTMDGFNATVLAYGQTGSGKSYTMGTLGNNESWDSMGIIPRAAEQIFATINEREANDPRVTIKISIQFLEVYGDDVRDLLDKSHSSKLVLREASNGDVLVLGAREELCTSAADVVELLVTGSRNRATAATSMNDSSSRSHAIFTVIIEQSTHTGRIYNGFSPDEVTGSPRSKFWSSVATDVLSAPGLQTRRSKFHFVDLAGSERVKRTNAQGQQLREGIDINKGLLALGNVISALGDDQKRGKAHVPYRDSKLTRLLQSSLGGNSKTLFLTCVSPTFVDLSESLNALKYANRARNIKNRPVLNRDPAVAILDRLKDLIQSLATEVLESRAAFESQTGGSSTSAESKQQQRFSRVSLEELVMRNFTRKMAAVAETETSTPALTLHLPVDSPTRRRSHSILSPNRNEALETELSRLRARALQDNQEIERLSEQVTILETYGLRMDQQLLSAEHERSRIESRLDAIMGKLGSEIVDEFDSVPGDEFTRRKSPSELTINLSDDKQGSESSQRDSINSDMSGSVVSGSFASQTMPKVGREEFLLQKLRRRDASLERMQQEKIDLSARYQAQSQELRRIRQLTREERACFEEDASVHRLKMEEMLSENVQLATELGTIKSQLCMLQQQQQLQLQRNLNPTSRNGTPPRNPFTSLIQSPADINDIRDTWREVQTGCRPTPAGSPIHLVTVKSLLSESPLLKTSEPEQFLQTPLIVNQVMVEDNNNENSTPNPALLAIQPDMASRSDLKKISGKSPRPKLLPSTKGPLSASTSNGNLHDDFSLMDDDEQTYNAKYSEQVLSAVKTSYIDQRLSEASEATVVKVYSNVNSPVLEQTVAQSAEVEALKKEVSELTQQLRSVQESFVADRSTLLAATTELSAQIESLEVEKKQCLDCIAELSAQVEGFLSASTDEVGALKQRLEELRVVKEEAIAADACARNQLSILADELSANTSFKEEVETLKVRVAELTTQRDTADSEHRVEIRRLQDQTDELRGQLSYVEESRNALLDQVTELSNQLDTNKTSADSPNKVTPSSLAAVEVEELYRQIQILSDENSRLLENPESTIQHLSDENVVLQAQMCELQAEIKNLQSNSQATETSFDDKTLLRDRIAKLSRQMQEASEERTIEKNLLVHEVNELRGELTDAAVERDHLLAKLTDLDQQVVHAQEFAKIAATELQEAHHALASSKSSRTSLGSNDEIPDLIPPPSTSFPPLDALHHEQEVEHLTSRVMQLNQRLQDVQEASVTEKTLLRDRIAKLNSQMADIQDESRAEKNRLLDEIAKLQSTHNSVSSVGIDNEVIRLTHELEMMRESFETEKSSLMERVAELSRYSSSAWVNDMDTKLSSVELERLNAQINDMSAQLQAAQESSNTERNLLRDRIARLSKQMAEIQDEGMAEKHKLLDEISDLNGHVSTLESDKSHLAERIEVLATEKSELEDQIANLKRYASSWSSSGGVNNEDASLLQNRIDDLTSQLAVQHQESNVKREELFTRITGLTEQLRELTDESSEERERLLGQIRYLEIRVRELEEENARLRGDMRRVVGEHADSQEQLNGIAGQLQIKEQSILQSHEQISLLSSQLDQVKSTARQPDQRLTKLWFAQESMASSDSGGRNEFMKAHRDIVELWGRNFNALLVFCQENGHANAPVDHIQNLVTSDASTETVGMMLPLGRWLREQRRMKRGQGRGRLLPERAAKLQRLADQGLLSWEIEE